MAHKKKGHLTTSPEWAKHLGKYMKGQFWSGERIAGKNFINKELKENYSIKVFEIDGNDFTDLKGFFHSIGQQLVENNDWGKNWNAFRDILKGGFIKTEYEEPFKLIWFNSTKSESGLEYYSDIVELIKEHDHIELIKK